MDITPYLNTIPDIIIGLTKYRKESILYNVTFTKILCIKISLNKYHHNLYLLFKLVIFLSANKSGTGLVLQFGSIWPLTNRWLQLWCYCYSTQKSTANSNHKLWTIWLWAYLYVNSLFCLALLDLRLDGNKGGAIGWWYVFVHLECHFCIKVDFDWSSIVWQLVRRVRDSDIFN